MKQKKHRHSWYQELCDCPHCPAGEHYTCEVCGEVRDDVRKNKKL